MKITHYRNSKIFTTKMRITHTWIIQKTARIEIETHDCSFYFKYARLI